MGEWMFLDYHYRRLVRRCIAAHSVHPQKRWARPAYPHHNRYKLTGLPAWLLPVSCTEALTRLN
jgi:hypothetical protein